jgi:hypothetical protein
MTTISLRMFSSAVIRIEGHVGFPTGVLWSSHWEFILLPDRGEEFAKFHYT